MTSHHVLLGSLVLCLRCPDPLSQEMVISDGRGCCVLLPRSVLPTYWVFSEDRPFCGSRLLWGSDSDGWEKNIDCSVCEFRGSQGLEDLLIAFTHTLSFSGWGQFGSKVTNHRVLPYVFIYNLVWFIPQRVVFRHVRIYCLRILSDCLCPAFSCHSFDLSRSLQFLISWFCIKYLNPSWI